MNNPREADFGRRPVPDNLQRDFGSLQSDGVPTPEETTDAILGSLLADDGLDLYPETVELIAGLGPAIQEALDSGRNGIQKLMKAIEAEAKQRDIGATATLFTRRRVMGAIASTPLDGSQE